jgi:hypothetical protein
VKAKDGEQGEGGDEREDKDEKGARGVTFLTSDKTIPKLNPIHNPTSLFKPTSSVTKMSTCCCAFANSWRPWMMLVREEEGEGRPDTEEGGRGREANEREGGTEEW